MARLFANNTGRLGVIRNPGLPAMITIAGWQPRMVMITSIGLGQACNVQIQPSLDNTLFLYSFGDRMGSIRIGGMAFELSCQHAGSGGREVLRYFAQNRVSKKMKHIRITIGGTTFSGFLMEMQMSANADDKRVFGFELVLVTVPELAAGAGIGRLGAETGDEEAAAQADKDRVAPGEDGASGEAAETAEAWDETKGYQQIKDADAARPWLGETWEGDQAPPNSIGPATTDSQGAELPFWTAGNVEEGGDQYPFYTAGAQSVNYNMLPHTDADSGTTTFSVLRDANPVESSALSILPYAQISAGDNNNSGFSPLTVDSASNSFSTTINASQSDAEQLSVTEGMRADSIGYQGLSFPAPDAVSTQWSESLRSAVLDGGGDTADPLSAYGSDFDRGLSDIDGTSYEFGVLSDELSSIDMLHLASTPVVEYRSLFNSLAPTFLRRYVRD